MESAHVIPPLVRRCPDCGFLGATRRFATVFVADRRFVECPVCGYRFAPVDGPRLA